MKVELKNLTKKFPNRNRKVGGDVTAVDNLSLTVPDGQMVVLLGPSGCGKSTALNMICGLLAPTSGQIFFGDEDVTSLPPEKRGIGMVFQNYALYPHLTARQNILFPLQNLKGKDKLTRGQMEDRMLNAAKLVQIENLLERKPAEMSGGQQQRVAIARALVKLPKVLLLDEPLSNLDARLRLQTREEIRRIQQETKITTVFVTHDQEEAMSISDVMVVMKHGVLQQAGKPQEIYDDPCNLFVATFLGVPPINVFDGAVKDGQVYIGEDAVLSAPGVPDGDITVAVRPEGFEVCDVGGMTCRLKSVEIMGRDITVVSTNPAFRGETVRSIVTADTKIDTASEFVHFTLRPAKVLLFDAKTGERVRF